MNTTPVTPNKRNTARGINLGDATPFPKLKFSKLPAGMELGGDGRAARTEWNWSAYKVKEGADIPREKYAAALSAAQNYAKKANSKLADGAKPIRFSSMAVRDEVSNEVIMETVTDEAGKETLAPKSYYIIRVS